MQAKPKATSQEEMETLEETIESLVKEMMRLGFKKTDAMQLISNTWNRGIKQKLKCNLLQMTEEEKEFSEKVDRFVHEYGEYFVGRALSEHYRNSGRYFFTEDILSEAKVWTLYDDIIYALSIYLKIVYVVFRRESSITQEHLRNYSKQIFGVSSSLPCQSAITLEDFLDDFIFVDDGKPICDPFKKKRKDHDGYRHFCSKDLEYHEFANQYKIRSVPLNRASLKLIWLIETYF